MSREWSESFCNRWLRSQAELPLRLRSILTYCTEQQLEQRLELVKIQKYVKSMNTGKAGTSVQVREADGSIELCVVDSKETF